MTVYRIEFSIQRADTDECEFEQIGFGSSGDCEDLDSAVFAVTTDVEQRDWETTDGMPDPDSVDDGDFA